MQHLKKVTIIQGSATQLLVELNATSFNAISMVTVIRVFWVLKPDPNNIPTARLDLTPPAKKRTQLLK